MTRRAQPNNNGNGGGLEAELSRVQEMLAHNSKVYKVFVYIMHYYFYLFKYFNVINANMIFARLMISLLSC